MNKFLEIPCDQAAAKPDGGQANPSHRILVVEDDRDLRQTNAIVLNHAGYAVDVAENGADAWDMLQANRYDLLITDNTMPKLTGIELLKKLRVARMAFPVIMATRALPTQELAKNPQLEPVAMLAKPYDTYQLLDTVKDVLHEKFFKGNQRRVMPKPNDVGTFSVELYTASRKLEWDTFVSTAKNATFLFARDYMDYHSDRFADHSLMIFNDHALVAVLPANLNVNGTLISHEGLTFGGLVVSRTATLSDVLASFHAMLHYLSQRHIAKLLYKRIPGFYNTLPDDEVAYALFLLDAQLYRRDCSAAVSQADRLPFRRDRKNLIKKAISLEVCIVQETSFQPFWEQVLSLQLAARYGVKPVHTLEEITLLAARFPEQIKQFSAYCGDEIVAGTTIYETPTVAHAQYGAVTEKGREIGAQAYLFGSLIEQYKDKRFFDFGISNEHEGRVLNRGLLDWKEGFGARCYAHDFYEIVTGNYPKLESVLQLQPETSLTTPSQEQASPAVSGNHLVRPSFAHPKALIDEGVSIGQGTRVWAFAHIVSGAVLGDDCNICDHTFIEGGVRIGHRVTVKCGVFLWDGLTVEDDVFIGPGAVFTNDSRPRSKKYLKEPLHTVLKEGCTLGANSTLLPGVTIGRWAMVGVGSVVTHDIPDYALMVGNPARRRAWVCRCGEKLSPVSGRLLGCVCGRRYELVTDDEVKEVNGRDEDLPGSPLVPDSSESANKNRNNGHCAGKVIHHFHWKRTLDTFLIVLALPMLIPLWLFIALLIRTVSAGPVLFKQERIGYRGGRFRCFKFRTMFVDVGPATHQRHLHQLMNSNAPMMKMDLHGDSRIIRFGRILRASGLDELPQLINVLRGEMSLVGPRPCLPYEYDQYLPWQKERFATVPGLTGLWQVSGKNKTTFVEMIQLDIKYAKNKTLWWDLKIVLMTVPALIIQMVEARLFKKRSLCPAHLKTAFPDNAAVLLP